jgi:dTDP-4-dehydrorhamnose 3,5-epimerase
MEFEELGIKGAWIARSPVHQDDRGYFREWFKSEEVHSATGLQFNVEQANISSSNKGVLRGIHYSVALHGQGKWITCITGSIWDVIVDIRPTSPTFKKWIGVELIGGSGDAIFISGGLGHGFVSLQNASNVAYLLTSKYSPKEEFEISPFDPELGIPWPNTQLFLSDKDQSAPTLQELLDTGNLQSRL